MNLFMIRVAALSLASVLAFACKKKDDNQGVPLVQVDIYIYTTDPVHVDISYPGGWENISGGSRGIVIYRKSTDEFMAFDRHCPYQPDDKCQVEVQSNNITAIDDCCESEYQIIDGSVLSGPSPLPLKQYQTSFNGSVLHIYN